MGVLEIPFSGGEGEAGEGSLWEKPVPGAPRLARGCAQEIWVSFVAPACAPAPLRGLRRPPSHQLQAEGAYI